MLVDVLLQNAVKAKQSIAFATTEEKNNLLLKLADSLTQNADNIIEQNQKDLQLAKDNISPVMQDRLRLDSQRIAGMAEGIKALIPLQDPIGECIESFERPNKMQVKKVRVPVGVVAMIYESRPNVTSDAAALCIKSGNVAVLRGGKEAINTNLAIATAMREACEKAGFDPNIISFVTDTSRDSAKKLMEARGKVDLLIPRGGAGLISACVEGAKVPCIETGAGICHLYVDKMADLQMAVSVLENAKISRPSVCNACEVCLVNSSIAKDFLPLLDEMAKKNNLQLRLCEKSRLVINGISATDTDFDTEFSDYILAVKIVDDITEAISHINCHSTHHSECIITNDKINADKFLLEIDSACVYHNVSTRFTDGGEFGLGCEIGIATQKIGARGPMGLKEITTYKYVICGNGQIR